MELLTILNNADLKAKEKTAILSEALIANEICVEQVIAIAKSANSALKATCIEGIAHATGTHPSVATLETLNFLTECLGNSAARVKWEAARVIANIAHLYPQSLSASIVNLLANANHSGTVVRWSTAVALGRIVVLSEFVKSELANNLIDLMNAEHRPSIKKIYANAINKVQHA